jgi:flagellin-like hook-associated protein FlgL
MTSNAIPLTSGIRSNLLLLQKTTAQLETTQLRLATGNRVNSALDGPAQFFAAKGLTQRAADLSSLKDNIGQAISTISAADSGVSAIENLVEQARGLTTQALGSLGNDANAVKLRKSLSDSYNTVLRQIDKLAQDSGYQGKNLLAGSGLRLDATESSKTSVNALAGISGARATNVAAADSYKVEVSGNGAISGSSRDIADAEVRNGLSNINISGFVDSAHGNFDPIQVKVSGGKGKDKTFTITEGGESQSFTLTQSQWEDAKATGHTLSIAAGFKSGTNISFEVDFDKIEDVPDTAGVGTSIIEKNVDLRVTVTNGDGQALVRDGLNTLGLSKLSDGENAFAFDSGTARVTVDQRQIIQSSTFGDVAGAAFGAGASALGTIDFQTIDADETYALSATAVEADFNYETGQFDNYTVAVAGSSGNAITIDGGATYDVTSANAGTAVAVANATNGNDIDVSFNYKALSTITTAAAATAAQVAATATASGGLTASNFVTDTVSGFAANGVTSVTIEIDATDNANASLTLSDGVGGSAVLSNVDLSAAASDLKFTISGGANDGAVLQMDVSAAVANGTKGDVNFKVRGAFTGNDLPAKFSVRNGQNSGSATLATRQVVDGSDANDLTVQFNESNTSQVQVVSQNVQADGQGLALDFAQNAWKDRSDVENAVRQLDAAKLKLRSASTTLSTNLNIIKTRESFTKEFTDVLSEGAGKLTLADQNEEGANILTLQTRQQLGTISLSLANQAQQAILRLF